MACKLVIGWLWQEIHLDKQIKHLTKRERDKIFAALFSGKRAYVNRRRPRKIANSFNDGGVKKVNDSIDFKKQSLSTTKCVS